jgi:hypothetical protein
VGALFLCYARRPLAGVEWSLNAALTTRFCMPVDDKIHADTLAELEAIKKKLASANVENAPDETIERIASAKKKLDRGEISGMSESTGHALLDEFRALRTELKEAGIFKSPVPAATDAKKEDAPFDLWAWLTE